MSSGNVIDLDEADARFIRKLSSELMASDLSKCFQCGVCVASCPVREIEVGFSPRKIMKLAKLGLKDEVLRSEAVWLCSMCFICHERCPQNVRPPEVMTVLRNIAASEGIAPPPLQKLTELLARIGRVYQIDDFGADERSEKGLPAVVAEPEFVKKISEAKQ